MALRKIPFLGEPGVRVVVADGSLGVIVELVDIAGGLHYRVRLDDGRLVLVDSMSLSSAPPVGTL